jgi:hypothetical protein
MARNMMDRGFAVNPFAPSKVAMSFTAYPRRSLLLNTAHDGI